VTVNVVSGEELANRNFHDLQQLQFAAPTLQVNGRAGAGINDYYIRGVGTAIFSNSIEYSVSTIVDGVVLALPEIGSQQYFDVERIEVLSGPQATLFGKNASAGVVNIVTRKPQIGVTEGKVSTDLGVFNRPGTGFTGRLEAVLNMPTSENTAVRISGYGVYTDPIVQNVLPNNRSDYAYRSAGIQGKFLYDMGEGTSLYISADYGAQRGLYTAAAAYRAIGQGGLPVQPSLVASFAQSGITPGPDNYFNNADGLNAASYRVGGAQAELSTDLGGGYSLSNLFAWRYFKTGAGNLDADFSSVNFGNGLDTPRRDEQFTNELRISSPTTGTVDFQGGIFLYKGNFRRDSVAEQLRNGVGAPPPFNARSGATFSTQRAKSAAIYGEATIKISPAFRLIGGGRLTYDEIKLDTESIAGPVGVPFFPVGALMQSRENTNFSYKLAAQYDFSRDLMGYVSLTRGYKGPAFNNTTSTIAAVAVDPEIATAYEIGLKSTLFDGAGHLNISAFRQRFTDYQSTSLDVVNAQVVLQNVGEVASDGVEVKFDARLASGLVLNLGAAYVDARATDFPNAPCYQGQTVAQGCIILRPGSPGVPALTAFDASGNQLPQAPKWTLNGGLRYRGALSKNLEGFAELNGYWRSDSAFAINGDPNLELKSYARFDLSFGIGDPDDRWKLGVYVHNLTDVRRAMYIQAVPTAPGSYQQSFNLSSFRTIGLTGSISF